MKNCLVIDRLKQDVTRHLCALVGCMPFVFALVVCGNLEAHSPQEGPSTRSEDQRFLEGLRERQLFELAENYLGRRLADTELSATDQGNLVIELIRLRMAAAVQEDDTQRDAKWKLAVAAGEDFLANRQHPRELVIRVQTELARLAEGKLLAQQLAAGIPGQNLRNRAVQKISEARRGLEDVVRDVANAIPQAVNSSDADSLGADELRSLQKNVRYQIANCNLQAAKLFPESDVENRTDALLQVIARLDEVANQTNRQMPLWWSIQIDRVEAYRLQGDLNRTVSHLQELSKPAILSSDLRKSDLLGQQIELAMDLGRGDPVKLVTAARTIQRPTPELDLALVRLMMHTGSRARAASERDKWQNSASQMTKLIEQNHGPYWGRLAELAVIGDTGNDAAPVTSTNLDILLRVGDEAWRKENLDDALKAFDKAYAQAMADRRLDVAMTSGMKAARILEQQGLNRASGVRLVELASGLPQQTAAPAAHLRGCWNLGRAAGQDTKLVADYADRLADHLVNWPEASTTAQARIWLGRLQASQKKWQEAFETLVGVPVDSLLLADAAALLPTVAQGHLAQLKASGQTTSMASQEFASQMKTKLVQTGIGPNDSWTRANRALLLSTAQFSLRNGQGDATELALWLQRALSESTDASAPWTESAKAWHVVALVGRQETAQDALDQAGELASNQEVLEACFEGVNSVTSTAESTMMDALKLKLIERALAGSALEAGVRNRWLSRKSTLLVKSGRGAEAIEMLQALIADQPRRADLQRALARALTGVQGRSDDALLQWRKVAAGSRQYSSGWFEAKYFVAKLLADHGKPGEAKVLLDYLKIPPGWGKSDWKDEFDELYRRVK